MPTYLGWTIVTMPATPWPAGLEVQDNALIAANTNPFTGQQQVQDWQHRFRDISVSLPALSQSAAANWVTFLKNCNGMANVFQFPSALCAKYPESFTNDGSTPLYFRLSKNQSRWAVKIGSVYNITFECREAT